MIRRGEKEARIGRVVEGKLPESKKLRVHARPFSEAAARRKRPPAAYVRISAVSRTALIPEPRRPFVPPPPAPDRPATRFSAPKPPGAIFSRPTRLPINHREICGPARERESATNTATTMRNKIKGSSDQAAHARDPGAPHRASNARKPASPHSCARCSSFGDGRSKNSGLPRSILRRHSRNALLAAGVLVAFGGGCAAGARRTDMLHFLKEHEYEVSAIEYRVGVPDAIAISAPRILEIDGEVQRIQPDGKINLRLLGEVKIVGMTAKEIAAKLEVLLSRYYVDPKVSVRVVDYASKKYYVTGQVGAAGPKPYTGRDTLIDAVLGAGVNFMSWTSHVKVVRPTRGEDTVRTIKVNVDKMVRTGDWSKNILLEPNDIVYVPPTPLAWVGLRFQELLFPVSPVLQAYTTPLDVKITNDYYRYYDQTGFTGTIARPVGRRR
ncbi:MAG: polysaccharide export protein [Planctomycetota bacterium]|nr:MAG: polysaccharide export protein [Planctomycetota bacterium]